MNSSRLTLEEADALRAEAAEKSVERDVAINAAGRASVNEAVAREVARDQGMAARSAEAQAAQANTLKHMADTRAAQEARSAETSRFGFYLLAGVVLLTVVLVIVWLTTRVPETNASIQNGVSVPNQSRQAPLTPLVAPPQTVVIPGLQGAQGDSGTPEPAKLAGTSNTSAPYTQQHYLEENVYVTASN